MTSFLTKVPAFKLLLLIMAGLVIGWFIGINGDWDAMLLLGCAAVAAALSLVLLLYRQYLFCYILISLITGIFLWSVISASRSGSPQKVIPEMPTIIEGEVVKIITQRDDYIKCIVDGWADAKPLPKVKSARILLSVYNSKHSNANKISSIRIGSVIAANAILRLPHPSQLPGEFNEIQYCAYLDVQWIARTGSNSLSVIGFHSSYLSIVHDISQAIKKINAELYSPDILGIVDALTTGDKSLLDYSQRQLFSLTGTAHVLAISGLHVGLIALFVLVLTGLIMNPWIKFAIFTIAIIAFVLITNVQPSAMRAGAMIIVYRMTTLFQRKISPVNAISLVVIIFIIASPEIILSVGFQMSVAAILGISLMFAPISKQLKTIIKMTNIVNTKNAVVRYIITSLSLSIAASIIISPIVAIYYHTFSIISPLANLIIIPLMSLSLAYSMLAIFASTFSMAVASIFATASQFLISSSIEINRLIVSIPYTYIIGDSTLFISIFVSLFLIAIFITSSLRQRVAWLAVVLSVLVILLTINRDNDSAISNIILRDKIVAAFIPDNKGNTFVIISDRKPGLYPIRDFALEDYIVNLDGGVRIAVNGIAGMSILDEIKKRRDVESFEINIEDLNKISRRISPGRSLNQLIEYR